MSAGPYARLGLRHNPFLADPRPGVAAGLWVNREAPATPTPGGRRLIQLLGEQGAGKTSLLLHWRAERPGPYRYVPPPRTIGERAGRWLPPPVAPLAYWDEADRVPAPVLRFALRRAARCGATVAAGTHRDLSAEATRAGLAVTTHAFPPLTPAALAEWCAVRIAAAALPGSCFAVPGEVLAEVCAAAGSSLREASVALHVWAAREAAARR